MYFQNLGEQKLSELSLPATPRLSTPAYDQTLPQAESYPSYMMLKNCLHECMSDFLEQVHAIRNLYWD